MANRQQSQKRREAERGRKQLFARATELFDKAIQAHRSGELAGARELYRNVIAAQPRHAEALHLLGFAEFQSSEFVAAIKHLEAAIALCPENGEFHNNLALAYMAAGQLALATQHATKARELGHADAHGYLHVGWELFQRKEFGLAESAYRLSLLAEPDFADAYHFLGILFAEVNRWEEAIASYRRALELRPNYIEALNNLGNAYRDQNRIDDAIPFYKQAIELDPHFAAAHNNLGVAFAQDGQTEAAIRCYERALSCQPQFGAALNNLANTCRDLGRTDDAISYYQRALELDPRSAEIRCNLGTTLRQQGHIQEAIGCFRRAIMLQPGSSKIHQHLASALADAGRTVEAAACCEHLVRLDPRQPLWKLRAVSCCPIIFSSRTDLERFTQMLSCGIDSIRRIPFDLDFAELTETAASCPFALQFLDGNLKDVKERFAAIFRERLAPATLSGWVDSWRAPRVRPRVGFVVSEGHEGVFLKSLRGVLARLSNRWELVVFCSHRDAGRVKTEIDRQDLIVIPLPTRLVHIAQTIAQVECDLLYYWEVGTDPINYFLPFVRLSPVQITSWGVQVTTGNAGLDAYVSNELVEPPDAQEHYTERLVLARTLLTYRQRTVLPERILGRDTFGVPVDSNWYVCPQQLGKFHVDFDSQIAGILRRDLQGAFVILSDKFGYQAAELRRRFSHTMPDVLDRIHFLPRMDQSGYLSLLQHANALLDPPHFGGVNTTYDGLSLGKPIVVWPSDYHRGRYTLGCYRKMGFLDCVVSSADRYIELAVEIGTNVDYRRELSTRILEASDVLFEDDQAVQEHERIFEELLNVTD
jgi:protein O-GlcNAc transferase